jgi:DNA-binding transcriptional regulator YiaG
MKKWKENLDHLVSLDYITFVNVPMRDSKLGPVIDLEPGALDVLAAKAILVHRIPIRGKECKFLRKVMGLSLEKFANAIGLTSASVFHWEKSENEQLSPINEAAVRAFAAEKLQVKMNGWFSELIGEKIQNIRVSAS